MEFDVFHVCIAQDVVTGIGNYLKVPAKLKH